MEPKITFQCTNEECEQHAKEFEIHYSSFFGCTKEEHSEDYWTARLKHCRSCYRTGEVKIEHGSRTFSDLGTFEEYVVGVAKEAKLLKKIVDRDVAEPEERKQLDESMKLLQGVKSPCCGQRLIETVDNGTVA